MSDNNIPSSSADVKKPPYDHKQILKINAITEGKTVERHIILPVDDTEDTEAALTWAIENVFRKGDVFHLLHVIPNPSMVHIWSGVYVPPDEEAELQEVEYTKDFVTYRFATLLVNNRIPFMLHVIIGNDDSESIAKVIQQKAVDVDAAMVIMSRHNKGVVQSWWVGSVTKELAKLVSQCPLVVVPPHPISSEVHERQHHD